MDVARTQPPHRRVVHSIQDSRSNRMSHTPSTLGIEEVGARPASRLLIAEDEAVSRSILEELAASWGYDVVVAEDGHQASAVLERDDAPRLAVLDWMMPGADGIEICRRVRSKTGTPYTYIIVLTALNEIDRMIEAMEAGADDFLGKPFLPHELEVRLRAGKRIVELQEELIAARDALREFATTDALTRTWNRRSILEILDKEIARAHREGRGRSPGVLMADLDHFKRVNDTYGHLAGDRVLAEAGERIRSRLRRHDEVGRFGGEEFMIVVSNCDADSLGQVAERIRDALAGAAVETDSGPIQVTLSLGGAINLGAEPVAANTLIDQADKAMYRAKEAGRNRVVVATGERGLGWTRSDVRRPHPTGS